MNRFLSAIIFLFYFNAILAQEGLYNGDVLFIERSQVVYVGGDFNNDHEFFENNGEFTLIGDLENLKPIDEEGSGTFLLKGTQSQNVDLQQEFKTMNFEIDNPFGAVFLGKDDLAVFGDFDFTNGILYTNSASLTKFKANSIHFYASDFSHIDGPCIKEGDTQFSFPIGKKSTLRPLRISETNTSTSFLAEYFRESYSELENDQTLNNVSDYEYWNFEKIFGEDDPTLTLVWDENSFVEYIEQDLRIAYFNPPRWTDVNSSSNLPEQLSTDITSIEKISSYGDFTFGSNNERTQLHDGFQIFNVNKNECYVSLDWKSIERASSVIRYEIYRKRGNENFELIESIPANNTSSIESYTYLDENVDPEFIYVYKLISILPNERTISSEERIIKTSCEDLSIYLYPNPIIPGRNLTIHVESDIKKRMPIAVVDELGRILHEEELLIDHGSNEFVINVERWGMAEYYIWTPQDKDIETLEFQIIR